MKTIIKLLILLLIFSCQQKENKNVSSEIDTHREVSDSISVEEQNQIHKMVKIKDNTLKNFTYEDIAKYTISSLMGQSPKIMNVTKDKEIYYVSYIRKSDNQKFSYKVKFENNKIIWGNFDGRWRNHKYDEDIRFSENENDAKINIIQVYSDGSRNVQEFEK